jgi:hypothetical protein
VPTNCPNGYTAYDSPTGCVKYICNEDLEALKTVDNTAVEVAKARRDDTGVFYYTDSISHEVHQVNYDY